MMISEFGEWLRGRTSKHKRPFQEETISAYSGAAFALDAWMTRERIEADFTGCDTAVLNRFFRWYYGAHGQGGTQSCTAPGWTSRTARRTARRCRASLSAARMQ